MSAAVLLTALIIGATGCSAPEAGREGTQSASLAEAITSLGGDAPAGTTNRAAVALTPEEDYFLRQAQELEQQRCMRAAGWEYHLNPVVEDPIVASVPGPDEIASGYRLSDVDKRPPADPNKAVLEGLSGADRDAWTTALMGDGPEVTLLLPGDESVSMNSTGCLADALTAVYGSVESAMAIRHARRQVTGDAAISSLLDNPTYMSKVDQWADCVSNAGYPLSSQASNGIDEAMALYRTETRANADRLAAQLAPIDAACQRQTGIADLRERLLDERAERLQAEEGINLGAAVSAQRAAVDRARSIVDGS